MSYVWDAVNQSVQMLCTNQHLRITNLVVAAANRYKNLTKSNSKWNGAFALNQVLDLSLSQLEPFDDNSRLWSIIADRALEAAHLGSTPEGMHSWAAAYQKASSTQKVMGAYATHDAFARALAKITLRPIADQKSLRIIDPSVGAGNLLLAALEQYGLRGTSRDKFNYIMSLHGVELDPVARELCCLLLWLSGADAGVKLTDVAVNIRCENALTLDWWRDAEPYDALLMNPPWESLRHKVGLDQDEQRQLTVERLSIPQTGATDLPHLFTAQGNGDRNLFKAFVELAPHLVKNGGRLGALLPAAFASDAGLAPLRGRYFDQLQIARWTSYENRAHYFPIDSRYKFGLLAATRSTEGTRELFVRGYATEPDEVDAPHILLNRSDIDLLGGKHKIIPEILTDSELVILRKILSVGTPFFEASSFGLVKYRREVDLTEGRKKGLFSHILQQSLTSLGDGTYINAESKKFVPLMEGRLVGAYDCAQKSWVSGAARTAKWVDNDTCSLSECTPQFVCQPSKSKASRIAFCDVTSATNTRTMIATLVPEGWKCGNTAPVLEFESELSSIAALGVLNSLIFDWVARRRVSGLHLNKFCLEGLVWPQLDERSIAMIAFAAWSICKHSYRSGLPTKLKSAFPQSKHLPKQPRPLSFVEAHATIEREVALAFSLSAVDLDHIYSEDSSDRRGFWRYYNSTPTSLEIVSNVKKYYPATV
jgi:hypothetical protein